MNFDDPGTYHLYYGDRVGHPGTILTFFPWEHAAPGRGGVGLAQQTTFRVPEARSAIGRTGSSRMAWRMRRRKSALATGAVVHRS